MNKIVSFRVSKKPDKYLAKRRTRKRSIVIINFKRVAAEMMTNCCLLQMLRPSPGLKGNSLER